MHNPLESAETLWWFPLWEFVVHVFVGAGIFVVIAFPAVGLNILIRYLSNVGIDQVILWGLSSVEYLLFAADAILFVIFLISSVIKTGKKLWQQ